MSIDEAIAHAREIANEQKRRSGICVQNNSECDKFSACLKYSEEHEQLAEWLEELKKRRSEDYGYMADIHQSIGYRKALDDFVKALCIEYAPVSDEMQNEYVKVCSRFEKIAEQLKVGGKNDNLKR